MLFRSLIKCKSLVLAIWLTGNLLDDDCLENLGEFVQSNKMMESFNIGYNRITDKGMEIITEFVIGNTSLQFIGLEGNEDITEKSMNNIIEIAKKTHITSLYIYDTQISDQSIDDIRGFLSIPVEQREIPLQSKTKSAAKVS